MRTPKNKADKWLEIGLRLHSLQAVGDRDGWALELEKYRHSSQTMNRFARAAAFLANNFQEDLLSGRIESGSSTMLEFIQIFELDPVLARSIAPDVFSDSMPIRRLRALRQPLVRRAASANGRAPHHAQRYQEFTKAAMAHLAHTPYETSTGELVHLQASMVRDTLAPKLHGTTAAGGRIAIDIKAPDPMAARTEASTSASMAARISILLLKFHQVVVVVPPTAKDYAKATLALLSEWAMEPGDVLRRSSFLVLDPETGQREVFAMHPA